MSFFFGNTNESKWTDPRTRPGYVSPFGRELEDKEKQQIFYETLARFTKKRTGSKLPIKDIAAELYYQDEKRKGNI